MPSSSRDNRTMKNMLQRLDEIDAIKSPHMRKRKALLILREGVQRWGDHPDLQAWILKCINLALPGG